MANTDGISKLETDTYRSRFDDGLLDLFIGIALLWIGMSWMWFEDLAAISGVIPAVLVVPFVPWRTRFIEARAGCVKFSESRRQWERRNLVMMFAGGVLLFVLALGALFIYERDGSTVDIADWIAPGIISLLLALMVGLTAFASMLPRLLAYTALLAIGGLAAAVFETNPGAPLLVVGAIITVWGAALTTRFVQAHPKPEGV